ncbi:phosphotransferase family protein [Streptomyces fractus]|uniref:phosphotransferase family protein n=1 Tax=Streptomyces fractus TaxID=641806 RepID=UPI003CEB7B20
MEEFPTDPDPWPSRLAERGHHGARRIGAGVEGVVYALGGGQVAKVWTGRPPTGLALSRQVYADIAAHRLPFATPEIFEVGEYGGVVVTYERELPGTSVHGDSAHEPFGRELPPGHRDVLLTVLRGLASVPATEAMRALAVEGDDRPLWQGQDRFPSALATLVSRAVARNGVALARLVPGLDGGVGRALDVLRSLPDVPDTVIHGDLVPPNIHVDASGRPVAVLDFGFYTTAGDPAFEAAVTAAVWDMYGPHAAAHTSELTRLFADELGYALATLSAYQAAYALTTYDLFGMGVDDGHFRWCAEQLLRNDVFNGRAS